jgi:broad specificity phosphatase PhoE
MKSALAAIEAEVDDGQTILIVGHGLSGQALVLAWLQLDPALNVALHFDTASVTELSVNEWGEREITRLNTTFFDPLVRL